MNFKRQAGRVFFRFILNINGRFKRDLNSQNANLVMFMSYQRKREPYRLNTESGNMNSTIAAFYK